MENSTLRKLASIPEDIIIGVLSRLPVKTLLRYKSVCKTWCNLIKTPYFQSMHHSVSQLLILTLAKILLGRRLISVFSFRSNDKAASVLSPDLEILATTDDHYFRIAGSCNGVVCYYDFINSTVVLSNPARREFKQLPPTSVKSRTPLSLFGVAFGFDSSNMYDFKVLRMFEEVKKNQYYGHLASRTEMFSFSSNAWRQVNIGLRNKILSDHQDCGLFCVNAFHFMVLEQVRKNEKRVILCCDIETERFRTMDIPLVTGCPVLKVVKEFLSILVNTLREGNLLNIWIMKEYGIVESWTKLYTIGASTLEPSPFCFYPSFLSNDDALALFEHENKKFKQVSWHYTRDREIVTINGFKYYSHGVVYKETLFSIT